LPVLFASLNTAFGNPKLPYSEFRSPAHKKFFFKIPFSCQNSNFVAPYGLLVTIVVKAKLSKIRKEMLLPSKIKKSVTLNVSANPVYLQLVTSFVEKSALAFGLDEPESLSLTLATEEIFDYLCRSNSPDKEVLLRCTGGGYYVEEDFYFEASDFNMKAFNLTAPASIETDEVLQETGLLIASRMVDRFRFSQQDDMLRLVLLKEKSYPPLSELPAPKAEPLKGFSIRAADPEELKLTIRLLNFHYPPHLIPVSLRFPGKIVDMVEAGDYSAIIASDAAGNVGGGAFWRYNGPKLIEFYGPYIFNQSPESPVVHTLIEHFIGLIAKSSAVGVIVRYPTPELPEEYFESLGVLTVLCEESGSINIPAYYRHLEEDLGITVWAHPALREFLRNEYDRLVFAREIRLITHEGELSSPFSVLSAEFDRASNNVTLRPVWWGLDSEENVSSHVRTLCDEGIGGILFELDLGKPWHSRFTPALLTTGFEPRLILPYAGKGDLVVFQHGGGELPR
jgi:hypothetical protein